MTPPLRSRTASIALLCLCALLAGCGHTQQAAQDPESAANTFFATLETGDPRAAYNDSAFGFQAAQTFDAFLSNAQQLGLIGGHPPQWNARDIHDTEARLNGTVLTPAGKVVNVSVTMTPEGKSWKLFALRTVDGSLDTENHFTLVGKGTGFNDVYHQPMPSPAQLDALVHQTIARFNTAVQQADFHDFYAKLSQQWKDGLRLSGDAASGVTVNMLKNHFQPFIDQKINLASVAAMKPVYDHPPLINEDGLLNLDGHFDTPAYRVNFSLEYAYELPWWRLFGINISLTR